MAIDPRIELLNSIADTVPPDYYRADGSERRFCAYVWFDEQMGINVGKSEGDRFLEFFRNPNYNTLEAHDHIRRCHHKLEVFFANAAITETAAFTVEYQLLYNLDRGHWPRCPSGEALHHLRRTAEQAVIPPTAKPLSKSPDWRDCKYFIADFLPDATLRLVENVWWRSETSPGAKFCKQVLIFSATVADALRLANEAKIPKATTPKAVQGHLKWAFRHGGIEIDGKTWAMVRTKCVDDA
jgi:hypothetical protein